MTPHVNSTVNRVIPAPSPDWWLLELSCGHMAYERKKTRPSVWLWECVGRRRKKRCAACSKLKRAKVTA